MLVQNAKSYEPGFSGKDKETSDKASVHSPE